MTCKHNHGDHIPALGAWLCGDCYRIMPERPRKYGLLPVGKDTEYRQDIVWQAEIRTSQDGLTLSDFLRTMARRYRVRCQDIGADSSYLAAISMLKMIGEPYGNPSFDWSHEGARDLADEDMMDWDQVKGGNS